MDSYYLRALHIGPQNIIPISLERHTDHVRARHCLIDAGDFERRYELLLGNFLAFEDFCAYWLLRGDIEMDHSYDRWATVILEANRHILNILSSGRTYLDQVVRGFKHFGSEGEFGLRAEELMKTAYDGSKDYRLVNELRNQAQHRALPVDGMESSIRPPADKSQTMMFYCDKAKIAADRGKFKKRVLDESEDKIDLRAVLRSYMTQMSGIHIALRTLVNAECERSRGIVTSAIAEYSAEQKDKLTSTPGLGLASVIMRDGKIAESVPLLLNWDDTRVKLAEKNRFAVRF